MIEIPLPSLGPDMESGKLLEWRIAPGQTIKKGDIIAVVDTEKAAIDVESWHDGTVAELLAAPGEVLAVGTIMMRLQGDDQTAPAMVARSGANQPRISPAARVRARSLGIDFDKIPLQPGAAAITVADVDQYARVLAATPSTTATAATDRIQGLRRAITIAMTRAKREIPHYYLWDEIDVSAMTAWLRTANAQRSAADKLLPAAVLLCAIARAGAEFQDMNGTHDGTAFQPSASVHLGVAIALRGGGLIAPALRDAQAMNVTTLMTQLTDLSRRARAGGLRSSEVSGQTLTVTNLGDDGSRALLGVIYPPQVALLGVGRIEARAKVLDGVVVARDCITISLAADHRVSDGRRGAQFLSRISALLQHPEAL